MGTPIYKISATAAAYAIPKAGSDNKIAAGYIPDLSGTYAAASHNHAASAITSGTLALARGGVGADLSATGAGFLRQATTGAAVTVSAIASADLTSALTTPPAIGGTTPAAIKGTTITATSSILVPLGSAAAPAIAFTAVQNTGIYNPFGSEDMGFVTGGSERVRLSNGSISYFVTARFNSGDASLPGLGFRSDTGVNSGLFLAANDEIGISTNGVERVRITNAGMGVGVSAATRLHVIESTANTVTPANVVTIGANSTGTAGAGFGAGLLWTLESSTTENRDAGRIRYEWTTATDASRTSKAVMSVVNAGTEVDVLTLTPTGIDNTVIGGTTPAAGAFSGVTTSAITGNVTFTNSVGNTLYLGKGVSVNHSWLGTATDADWALSRNGAERIRFASGETSIPLLVTIGALDSGSASGVVNYLIIRRNNSGTPSGGFGASLLWRLQSSTTYNRDAAIDEVVWNTTTDAGAIADRIVSAYYNAGGTLTKREGFRVRGGATATAIGFFGATPVAKPDLGAWAGLTDAQKLDALRDALSNLGLASYS